MTPPVTEAEEDYFSRMNAKNETAIMSIQMESTKPIPQSATEKQIAGNHYKSLTIQPAEYCQKNKLNYMESSAIKYITRHQNKNGKEDILKAIHCLELLLEYEYNE